MERLTEEEKKMAEFDQIQASHHYVLASYFSTLPTQERHERAIVHQRMSAARSEMARLRMLILPCDQFYA